jgi:hypothetical protein
MRYYLTITGHKEARCHAAIHREQDIDLAHPINPCKLTPQLPITIKREPLTLGQIAGAFSLYDPGTRDDHAHIIEDLMDQAGQIALGDLLFTHTFGSLSPAQQKTIFEKPGDPPEIRIVTNSPFIVSLPWVLMRRDRVFLFLNDCSIALRSRRIRGRYFSGA